MSVGDLPAALSSLTWYKQPEEFGSMAENAQPEELGRDYERRTQLNTLIPKNPWTRQRPRKHVSAQRQCHTLFLWLGADRSSLNHSSLHLTPEKS